MDKEKLLTGRTQFFNDIVSTLTRPLGKLDQYFEQDKYYTNIDKDTLLIDVANGELIAELNGNFFGTQFRFLYSVWQVGTKLKIGLLVKTEEVFEAFGRDEQAEILDVWGNTKPSIKMIHGGAFYDWEFDATHLYESYMVQENYTMGVRHMHLRALKTVYDYLAAKEISNTYNNNDSQVN